MLLLAVLSLGTVQGADATNHLEVVLSLWRSGKVDQAMDAATQAIGAEPKNARLWSARAQMRAFLGLRELADADLTAAIELEPDSGWLRQERAQGRFRLGRVEEAVADFDKANELTPRLVPQNWQRGIALYYVGRFEDARKQFEVHQTVNTQDVENAAWHFLCTAREKGVADARANLIPIQRDGRIPMKEIQQLFAGKATAKDVFRVADKADDEVVRRVQQFYAHLYIGLFCEAEGRTAERDEHIRKAAELAEPDNYMGVVARVHAQRLKLTFSPKKP